MSKKSPGITKVTVHYADGTVNELSKAMVFEFEEKSKDKVLLYSELLNMNMQDLGCVIDAVIQLAQHLEDCSGSESEA